MHQIVPKASGVAEVLHHDVPALDRLPGPVPTALACPHSGAPCPALTALFASLAPAGEEANAWIQALAPCGNCRVAFEAARDKLRHLRLGQREREILLAAAAGGPLTVTEPGMSRSLSAARRRAALSLGEAGLVASDTGRKPAGGPQRATVILTAVGRYVMAAYGRFLKAGKPVRWTRPARGVLPPGQDPSALRDEALARTEAALRETLDELKGVLVAAIGRKFKDPERLDSVTRHLERKATLLKAVLQPARTARA